MFNCKNKSNRKGENYWNVYLLMSSYQVSVVITIAPNHCAAILDRKRKQSSLVALGLHPGFPEASAALVDCPTATAELITLGKLLSYSNMPCWHLWGTGPQTLLKTDHKIFKSWRSYFENASECRIWSRKGLHAYSIGQWFNRVSLIEYLLCNDKLQPVN